MVTTRVIRPWGWFETVSESPGSTIKRIGVDAGQRISLQRHRHRAEHWLVVRGTAHVTLDADSFDLGPGRHVDIPLGALHRLSNRTAEALEIVEVQMGTHLSEDDIERLNDDYGRS